MAFDRDKLVATLESPEAEGFRATVYRDTTGNLTVGIGWNCSQRPMTRPQARVLCGSQLDDDWQQLVRALPWAADLDEPRATALMEMAFNLGLTRLLGFHDMLASLRDKRWLDARDDALNSEWAKQVGHRAERIAESFANGVYP